MNRSNSLSLDTSKSKSLSFDSSNKNRLKNKLKNSIFNKQKSKSAANSPIFNQNSTFESLPFEALPESQYRSRSYSLPNFKEAYPNVMSNSHFDKEFELFVKDYNFPNESKNHDKYNSVILQDNCDCADCKYGSNTFKNSTPPPVSNKKSAKLPSISSICSSIKEEPHFEETNHLHTSSSVTSLNSSINLKENEDVIDKMATNILNVVKVSRSKHEIEWLI